MFNINLKGAMKDLRHDKTFNTMEISAVLTEGQ